MALTYSIKLDGSLILAVARGTVTYQDVLDYVTSLTSDECIKPGMKELIDLRAADKTEVTSSGLLGVAMFTALHKEKLRGTKCAMVAGKDLAFGLAKTYQAYSESEGIEVDRRVFTDFDEACEWLGIDPGCTK